MQPDFSSRPTEGTGPPPSARARGGPVRRSVRALRRFTESPISDWELAELATLERVETERLVIQGSASRSKRTYIPVEGSGVSNMEALCAADRDLYSAAVATVQFDERKCGVRAEEPRAEEPKGWVFRPHRFRTTRLCRGCSLAFTFEETADAQGEPSRKGQPRMFHDAECQKAHKTSTQAAVRRLGAALNPAIRYRLERRGIPAEETTDGLLHAIAMAEDIADRRGWEGRTVADVLEALNRLVVEGVTK